MQNAHVFHLWDALPIERGNGVRSLSLVGADSDSETLLTGMSLLPTAMEILLQTHGTDECIVLLEGRATCEVADQRHELKSFDTTFVLADVPPRFINVGVVEMRILWIYRRTDTTRTFVATGETSWHLDRYKERQPKPSCSQIL